MKFETDICNDKMSFEDCELAILRNAIDETESIQKGKIANSDDVKKMIDILEQFLRKKRLICYGGTAINNILPEEDQFYDRSVEIPDYDFFSLHAAKDAKELADLYYKAGFEETEAKSGIHKGTYKVFVNYIPMADITELDSNIFRAIQKDAITIQGISYAPPNYLRMGMFLELSRPAGDVSRWEKVFKRLSLLNKNYPLKAPYNCRSLETDDDKEVPSKHILDVFYTLRETLVSQGVVFFGGYAASFYSKYYNRNPPMPKDQPPEFDVIVENPEKCATVIKERLADMGVRNVKIIRHDNLEDVIPEHYQVVVGKHTVAFLFSPIACYNYNVLKFGSQKVMIATIDTMLSFYLAFAYSNKSYFNVERILCMAQMMFDIEEKNRVNRRGILKRFSANCYGEQPTLASIRAAKSEKYKELVEKGVKRGSTEWNEWFFKYSPGQEKGNAPPSFKQRKTNQLYKPVHRRTQRRKRSSKFLFSKFFGKR